MMESTLLIKYRGIYPNISRLGVHNNMIPRGEKRKKGTPTTGDVDSPETFVDRPEAATIITMLNADNYMEFAIGVIIENI